MATKNTRAKGVEIKVTRAEYLKDPFHYSSQANNRRRVIVTGESGEVVKVIGGHLNYSQATTRVKRSGC